MNSENEWDFIWRRQKLPEGKTADIATLLANFEAQRRKQARTFWLRDIGEASASLLVAVVFGVIALKSPKLGYWIWPAVLLVLGVGSVFVRERLRARKLKTDPAKPLLEKLGADIAELRHQRRLLLNLGVRYFAPLSGAMLLIGGSMALNASPTAVLMLHDPFVISWLVGYALLCIGLGAFAWMSIRRTVRKRIEPRLEELVKLHQYALNKSEDT